jgi:hypothetical protein
VVYTWGGATTGNWSTPTNWTPNGDPGSADTANISNLTATTTVNYDVGAPGSVGTLNMLQTTSATADTYLVLAQNFTINTGGTLYSTLGNGGSTGIEQIDLGNSTLNIGTFGATTASNATYTLGSTSVTTVVSSSAANIAFTNASTSGTATTGTGAVSINGTLVVANSSTSNGYSVAVSAPVTLAGGTSTATEAVLNVDNNITTAQTDRPYFLGNFTSTGTTLIEATGTGASVTGSGNAVYFEGPTTTIGSGTTFTGFTGSGQITWVDNNLVETGQTINLAALVPSQQIRSANTAGTLGNVITYTKTFTSTATSGAVSNAFNQLAFSNSKTYTYLNFVLGSNLNLAASQTSPFTFSLSASAGIEDNIDLNGFSYNATASSSTVTLVPTGTTAGTNSINIINSGASSISGNNGIFTAASYTLSGADVGIGSGVILQANGATSNNNLGQQANGVTTISPSSTFYYTGAGTAAAPGSLTSNRAIGALTVGIGPAASSLELVTTGLSVAGNVTVNSGSTLQVGGQTLMLTSTANLTGTGTVAGTTAGTASIGNAITFTGTGGIVPGAVGTVGNLTLSGTETLTLASGSVSAFAIMDANTADNSHLTLATGSTITLAYAGQLALTFLNGYTPATGTTFQIVDSGATTSGNFSSITSNLPGDSFSFVPSTGVLTVNSVPEPESWIPVGIAFALLIGAGARQRISRRRV